MQDKRSGWGGMLSQCPYKHDAYQTVSLPKGKTKLGHHSTFLTYIYWDIFMHHSRFMYYFLLESYFLFFFSIVFCFSVFSFLLSLHPSSSWPVCKTWWQSIRKGRTEREEPVFYSFLFLHHWEWCSIFEHLVEKLIVERENPKFFSGFSFGPVSPSLMAATL